MICGRQTDRETEEPCIFASYIRWVSYCAVFGWIASKEPGASDSRGRVHGTVLVGCHIVEYSNDAMFGLPSKSRHRVASMKPSHASPFVTCDGFGLILTPFP